MQIPISGLVFVPLILLVCLFRPSRIEEVLIYTAVFQGAAVLNTGGGFSVGLSPYFFTTCLLAILVATKWVSGRLRFRHEEFAQSHLRIVCLFVGWCVLSAFFLPFLFEGIPVDTPRAGTEAVFYLALPLRWSFSNAGQAGYMVLNFLALLAFTDFIVSRPSSRLLDAYSYSGVIVVLVGLYQMAAYRAGLPFPSAFFNSNASWGQAYNQMIGGGYHRVSATFVEPSDAGGFLSSWLLFELVLANWGTTHRSRHWLFALLGSIVLLATTSSAGYLMVALTFVALAARVMLDIVTKGRVPVRIALATVGLAVAAVMFLFTVQGNSLLDAVLWQKSGSSSATYRMATIWRAVAVMRDTCGLGAGLGSNRALSLLAYIGSNLGVFGLVAFLSMVAQLLFKTFSLTNDRLLKVDDRIVVLACASALLATLIDMTLAGAEISSPRLWILWGLLLATIRAHSPTLEGSERSNASLNADAVLYPVRSRMVA